MTYDDRPAWDPEYDVPQAVPQAVLIYDEEQLAAAIGVSADAIGKALFKGTQCGVNYGGGPVAVLVSGYAEGSDADCEIHTLCYPFAMDEFWAMVSVADNQGVDLWNETHDDEGNEI